MKCVKWSVPLKASAGDHEASAVGVFARNEETRPPVVSRHVDGTHVSLAQVLKAHEVAAIAGELGFLHVFVVAPVNESGQEEVQVVAHTDPPPMLR